MSQSISKICEYCHTNLKNGSEVVVCPQCQTPYHPDCWLENNGCAVYGCGYKQDENAIVTNENSPDSLVEIEFLINERKYIEAIDECKRLLRTNRNNVALKRLYNKAVSHVNAKTKLIEEGDNFFETGDYNNASVFYNRALRYCNEYDSNVLQSKLEIINHNLPIEIRRKKLGNFFTALIILVMLFLGAASYYYFIVMEVEREFAKIEKEDDISDFVKTELQLTKYENFRKRNPDSKWGDKADEKVNAISAYLANELYKEDWRTAKKYLDKIDKAKVMNTYRELEVRILSEAKKEFDEKLGNAVKFNQRKNFTEAKYSLESALEITDHFNGKDFNYKKGLLISNLNMLKEKISNQVRYRNIIDEIEEKKKDVGAFSRERQNSSGNTTIISGIVTDILGNGVIAVRSVSGNRVALNTGTFRFSEGEKLTLETIQEGRYRFFENGIEESLPMYVAVLPDRTRNLSPLTDYEQIAIEQRLAYLLSEKRKLDSLMALKLVIE